MLTRAEAQRLAKLLGMLGSACEAERAYAAAKANELVREAGLTWEAIVTPLIVTLPPPEVVKWRSLVQFCLEHVDDLSDRDSDFIAKLSSYRCLPSDKQLTWLYDIVDRLQRGEVAA